MAKIAVELKHALARRAATGTAGIPTTQLIAQGAGWTVEDVVCTSGPGDRTFEEQHSKVRIAIVAAGTFHYRASRVFRTGRELMTPGSLLLGSPGQYFECGHESGSGDRCISFGYTAEYFGVIVDDASRSGRHLPFDALRLPPLREFAPLIARACAGLAGASDTAWEELGLTLAARVMPLTTESIPRQHRPNPGVAARVADLVRAIERNPAETFSVESMGRAAGLSPYHFLRVFEQMTGVTPHQYVLRARLREAAVRLSEEPARILDIALDSGFGDVSNFNRAFRAEFGVSPRAYRKRFGRCDF